LIVDSKAGDQPVTNADHAASALIVAKLRAEFPNDVVLSEEIPTTARAWAGRASDGRPVDGTRDFILGHDGFRVDDRSLRRRTAHRGRGVAASDRKDLHRHRRRRSLAGSRDAPSAPRQELHTSTLAGPPGIRLVARSRTARRASTPSASADDPTTSGTSAASVSRSASSPKRCATFTSTPAGAPKGLGHLRPEAILHGPAGA